VGTLVVQVKVAKNPKHKVDFSKGFEHVVIHPGAVKVIDGVRTALGFGDKAAIPSLQTLNRFGNTSSSSTLYILANIESRIGVKKGDNVLQLAMGAGFKYGLPIMFSHK
jgi:3-ketoacyl-CoA synthase